MYVPTEREASEKLPKAVMGAIVKVTNPGVGGFAVVGFTAVVSVPRKVEGVVDVTMICGGIQDAAV
jgi:hypothetical protein